MDVNNVRPGAGEHFVPEVSKSSERASRGDARVGRGLTKMTKMRGLPVLRFRFCSFGPRSPSKF